MNLGERLRTIAVTATVTSVGWVLAGSYLMLRPVAGPAPVIAPSAAVAYLSSPPARQAQPMALAPAAVPVGDLGSIPARLTIPVQGTRASQLIDTFTQSRSEGRVHNAIDIMAPRGTPVLAAAAGQLEKLFVSVRGGNTIYIRSPDRRTMYYYAHLDHYAPGIAEGQAISAGQVIGAVGFTGDASPDGPHLHFAINAIDPAENWSKGTPINPYPLLMRR